MQNVAHIYIYRKIKNIFDFKELISINGSWAPIVIEVS
jgi:hypothetical protein